jgi:hypothetical protein
MNTLRKLHTQIDKEYDAESLALEEEYNRRRTALVEARDRDHVALDRRWTKVTAGQEAGNGLDNPDDGWPAFMANDVIEALIENSKAEEKIHVDSVYRQVIQLDPKLKERKPQVIRTQISRTLLKLVDLGVLEFVRKGKGGQPHIYRRVPTHAVGASAAGQ